MAIHSYCDGCGQPISVADELAGHHVRCPHCAQIFVPQLPTADSLVALTGDSEKEDTARGRDSASIPIPPHHSPSACDYWMRSGLGEVWGPVTRQVLDRWFREGRVGQDYAIRIGEEGAWQPAAKFVPLIAFVETNESAPGQGGHEQDQPQRMAIASSHRPRAHPAKPDRALTVLTMGILAWALCCVCGPLCILFAALAVALGKNALRDIAAGVDEADNVAFVQTGYYLGLAFLIFVSLVLIVGSLSLGILYTLGVLIIR
ncbi:MAG: hypothetical protein KatS3mg111_3495 [Pirellulaceae bacterium]|nr:MAG: hypothetical protein KatS3mg111_3495 [Pirellulaceae bacterium]